MLQQCIAVQCTPMWKVIKPRLDYAGARREVYCPTVLVA